MFRQNPSDINQASITVNNNQIQDCLDAINALGRAYFNEHSKEVFWLRNTDIGCKLRDYKISDDMRDKPERQQFKTIIADMRELMSSKALHRPNGGRWLATKLVELCENHGMKMQSSNNENQPAKNSEILSANSAVWVLDAQLGMLELGEVVAAEAQLASSGNADLAQSIIDEASIVGLPNRFLPLLR